MAPILESDPLWQSNHIAFAQDAFSIPQASFSYNLSGRVRDVSGLFLSRFDLIFASRLVHNNPTQRVLAPVSYILDLLRN
jgi:hypothetical protein